MVNVVLLVAETAVSQTSGLTDLGVWAGGRGKGFEGKEVLFFFKGLNLL